MKVSKMGNCCVYHLCVGVCVLVRKENVYKTWIYYQTDSFRSTNFVLFPFQLAATETNQK